MFSMLPVERSSTTSTVQPRSRRASDRWDPMKPAPPVISALDMLAPVVILRYGRMARPDGQAGAFGSGPGDGASSRSSKPRTKYCPGRSIGGGKVDLADDRLHSSALSLTEATEARLALCKWREVQHKVGTHSSELPAGRVG